jgi:putative sterol carrier protein
MAPRKQTSGPDRKPTSVQATLEVVAKRAAKARARRSGSILLRLTGEGGGDHYVHLTGRGARVSNEASSQPPDFEVIGDARRIQSILEGKKEGRAQFFAGGIRVRGDLTYLGELAYELGLIKEPLDAGGDGGEG